jgi:hypothetical protein
MRNSSDRFAVFKVRVNHRRMEASLPTRELSRLATFCDRLLSATNVRLLCAAVLIMSLLAACIVSLHWPLLGDSSLMHYVVFLMHQGLAPYRDIADVNLPGTYVFEAAAMRVFGTGAAGWRTYDLTLIASILAASMVIAGRKRWFAGVFAGCLFGLVHLQDGLAQAGQRDLLMAALLLWAYATLCAAIYGRTAAWKLVLFGLLLGCTLIIKPVLLPLAICLLLLLIKPLRSQGVSLAKTVGLTLLGLAIPPALTVAWVIDRNAAHTFWTESLPLIRLHAQLGRQSLSYLLAHSIAPVGLLILFWIVLQLFARAPLTFERTALLLGIAGSAFGYIAQGKGYPYQRYPLLAVMLLLLALDVDRCLESRGLSRYVALLTCAIGSLIFAPRFATLTSTFSTATPFQDALAQHLKALDAPGGLSGNVQCLDTFGGCIDTLYKMRLRQSTGFLYDCYLFASPNRAEIPVRDRYRSAFLTAYRSASPGIVILTNQFCFGDPRGFNKLNLWPTFAQDLAQHYRKQDVWRSSTKQHWWSRREEPTEFVLYIRTTR